MQLEAALQESKSEADHFKSSLELQLQQFHQTLHTVKGDTEAAQRSAEV